MRVRAILLPEVSKSFAPVFSIYLGPSHRPPREFTIYTPGNFDIELVLLI